MQAGSLILKAVWLDCVMQTQPIPKYTEHQYSNITDMNSAIIYLHWQLL